MAFILPNGQRVSDIYTLSNGQSIYYPALADGFSRSVNQNANWIFKNRKMGYNPPSASIGSMRWSSTICRNKRVTSGKDTSRYKNRLLWTDCSGSAGLILAWAVSDIFGAPADPLDGNNVFYNYFSPDTRESCWIGPYTGNMYNASSPVSPAQAQVGDLIFFGPSSKGTETSHVAVIININPGFAPRQYTANPRFLLFDHGGPDAGTPPRIRPLMERDLTNKPIVKDGIRRMKRRSGGFSVPNNSGIGTNLR